MKRVVLLPLGMTLLTIGGCDDYDAENIGRDAGPTENIVRRLDHTVAYPSNHAVFTEAFLDGTPSLANRLTCRDEDGQAQDDLFCPVSFRIQEKRAYDCGEMPVEGDLPGALFLQARGTTVGIACEFLWAGERRSWTLGSLDQLPPGSERLIGEVKFGIIVEGRSFADAQEDGRPLDFLQQRFAETVAHEFVHLAGVYGHLPANQCLGNESLTCRQIDLTEGAPQIQQFKVSRFICDGLYLSEDLESSRIAGLDETTVSVAACE